MLADLNSLGGSGSGKTTLLNLIAYRGTGLPVEDGEVAYHAASTSSSVQSGVNDGGDARKTGKKEMGRRIGFVKQQDFLVGHLTGKHYLISPSQGHGNDPATLADTLPAWDLELIFSVRETLTYAARLRLPPDLSRGIISTIVEQVIDELGLRDAADTVVGGPLRKGISGGEKR